MPQEHYNELRGTLPGMNVNFLENGSFSLEDPKMVAFFDTMARNAVQNAMKRVGAKPDSIPLQSEVKEKEAEPVPANVAQLQVVPSLK
jgi:hypothetical protein